MLIKRITLSALIVLGTQNVSVASKFSIEGIGDILTLALPAYAFGMTATESGWEGTIQFAEAYLATSLTTEITRGIVNAPRPNGLSGGFPSGHTSSAFSAATFIHKRYGIKQAIIPYTLAAFTGYSRIHSDWHYPHQVIAGAVIGGLFTWIFVDKYNDDSQFLIESDGSGVKLNFRTVF